MHVMCLLMRAFVLGCELCEENYESVVKECTLNLWEVKFYGVPSSTRLSLGPWLVGSEGYHCG